MMDATWAVWKADWKGVRSADEKAAYWAEMLAGMSADEMAWTMAGQSADEKVAPWVVWKDARLVATWVAWKVAGSVETKAVSKAGQWDSVDRKPVERSATMPTPTRIVQFRSLS